MSDKDTFKTLPAHPTTSNTFKEWFKEYSRIMGFVKQADPFEPEFQKIANVFNALSVELAFELGDGYDRSGSVYDRPDYIVREFLRTNSVILVISYLRSLAENLAQGKAKILPTGRIQYDGSQMEEKISVALLREIPTTLALIFTASEAVATINIDDLLKICCQLLDIAIVDPKVYVPINQNQFDLFTAIVKAVKSCIENVKNLNTSLFFTLFQDFKLMKRLVDVIPVAYENGIVSLTTAATQCLNLYIQASQAEPDLKENAKNEDFKVAFNTMMEKVVNPLMTSDRSNRSKFRSIMHYSRTIK